MSIGCTLYNVLQVPRTYRKRRFQSKAKSTEIVSIENCAQVFLIDIHDRIQHEPSFNNNTCIYVGYSKIEYKCLTNLFEWQQKLVEFIAQGNAFSSLRS